MTARGRPKAGRSTDGGRQGTRPLDDSKDDPVHHDADERSTLASDTRTGVNDLDYNLRSGLPARSTSVTFKLGPSQLLPTDEKAAEDAAKSADN